MERRFDEKPVQASQECVSYPVRFLYVSCQLCVYHAGMEAVDCDAGVLQPPGQSIGMHNVGQLGLEVSLGWAVASLSLKVEVVPSYRASHVGHAAISIQECPLTRV